MEKTYFSINVRSIDDSYSDVPVLSFDDPGDVDYMINALITLADLGIDCTLTCEVFGETNSNSVEDLVK